MGGVMMFLHTAILVTDGKLMNIHKLFNMGGIMMLLTQILSYQMVS